MRSSCTQLGQAAKEHDNMTVPLLRSRHVRGASFNINSYSQYQRRKDFRFTNADIDRLLELRSGLLSSRAKKDANASEECGAPLDKCAGFIYCMKIRSQWLGDHGTLQRSWLFRTQ